jgi:hypothetical protein
MGRFIRANLKILNFLLATLRITKIPYNKKNIYLFFIIILFYSLLLGPDP